MINKVIRDNIDFKKPEDGEVGLRLVNLAKEKNVNYTPSMEMIGAIHSYCQRKMLPVPEGLGGPDAPPVPTYQPQPPIQPMQMPPQMPPPGYNQGGQPPPPYGGGGDMGGGMGGGGGPPTYVQPPIQPAMDP